MKRKSTNFKLLLVVMCLLVGASNVWGDEVTTYSFTGQADNSTPTLNSTSNHKAANAQNVYTSVDAIFRGRIALQNVGSGTGFYYKNNQLVNEQGDRYFSLLDLKTGDKIEFTFSSVNAGTSTDKHFTVQNCGTGSTTNLSLTSGGSAIAADTDLESGTTYYVLADGYIDFKTRKNFYLTRIKITRPNDNLPDMTRSWGQGFINLPSADFQMEITTDGGAISKGISAGESNYYVPSNDGTNAFTHPNIGFYVAYSGNGNHRRWKLYSNTSGGIYSMVNANMDVHLYNLIKGQIVKVRGSALYAGSGTLTALSALDNGPETNKVRYYQVNANGTGVITVSGNGRIYSVDVYNTDNEIVGLLDKSSGFATWVGSGIDVPENGAVRLQFKNNGTNTQNYYNWCLGINNASDGFLANIRADWAALDAGGAFTYTYASSADAGTTAGTVNWTTFKNDLEEDAEVDLNLSYKSGKLYITGTTTKGDNVYYFNYTYGDGSYSGAKYIVHPFVEKAWLEITSTASTTVRTAPVHATNVTTTLGANGFATYANNTYPLNLTTAEAYKASVEASTATVTFSKFEQNVPVSTGMLLKGDPNETVSLPIADESSAVASNDFLVNVDGTTFTAEATYTYFGMLKAASASDPVTFATFAPGTVAIPASKAYLKVLTSALPSAARELTISFGEDETTGIHSIDNGKMTIDNSVYDLSGRRVAQPAKGLYIVNGKKVIVK